MLRGHQLGSQNCTAIDAYIADPANLRREPWSAFVDRVFSTLIDGHPDAFFGALWVLANAENYVHKNVVGTLLVRQEIPCEIDLAPFVEILLHNLNASANETVRYLTNTFGHDAVLARAHELMGYDLTPTERQRLDCLRYWLGEHPSETAPR